MKGALVFNIFVEISSYPEDFFKFKDLIILSISLVDVLLNCIVGKGLWNNFAR
jgi:hypothetical protein